MIESCVGGQCPLKHDCKRYLESEYREPKGLFTFPPYELEEDKIYCVEQVKISDKYGGLRGGRVHSADDL